jgi:hypothetical protein
MQKTESTSDLASIQPQMATWSISADNALEE